MGCSFETDTAAGWNAQSSEHLDDRMSQNKGGSSGDGDNGLGEDEDVAERCSMKVSD